MDNHDLILEALQQAAAEPCTITPEQLKLDGYRMTSQTPVQAKEFLFRLFGKPCFPRKDVTTITGPAKSGKTFFTSMAMACCVERQVLALERISEEPLKVMWYDTEQSLETTKEILTERIGRMIHTPPCPTEATVAERFPDEQFFVFNVRRATLQERSELLGVAIETYRPDLVIIDGIADLLADINDGPKATELMERLLVMADTYGCNITTIIHLNRTGEKSNLRGWLGSVMLQKSFEVFNCSQVEKTETFSVELSTSRKYRNPLTLYYEIGADGIPTSAQKPDVQPRDNRGRWVSSDVPAPYDGTGSHDTLNSDYIIRHDDASGKSWEWDLRRLFTDAMGGLPSMGNEQMRDAVMRLGHIRQYQYYYKLLAEAEKNDIVVKTYDRYKRVAIILRPLR